MIIEQTLSSRRPVSRESVCRQSRSRVIRRCRSGRADESKRLRCRSDVVRELAIRRFVWSLDIGGSRFGVTAVTEAHRGKTAAEVRSLRLRNSIIGLAYDTSGWTEKTMKRFFGSLALSFEIPLPAARP